MTDLTPAPPPPCFLDKLDAQHKDLLDDGLWVVMTPLVYISKVAGITITVPAGFQTDFASVPRLPIAYALFGDTSDEAAVVHDYLYTTHLVPRVMADAVLREASKLTGVPAWRRWPMWLGVRLFGGTKSHWGK